MTPKIFRVGGSVRDQLLGLEPKDLDYVVVGANLQWMLDQGFKQVGASFPVFLHPVTGDEYAMARREKKVAPGYQGFEFEFGPDVTIEEDLSRRDLTMNSIAYDPETETYIDPYGGTGDLRLGVIRHTSEAFAEDPLRVLRAARFAARYNFVIDPETEALCRQLVEAGELDALSTDRIWGEIDKLFSEQTPSIGLKFLRKVGALEIKRLKGLVFKETCNQENLMNKAEKMFFMLNIKSLSKDRAEEFRIPSQLVREQKFMREIAGLLTTNIVHHSIEPVQVVLAFDQFREEFMRGDLAKFHFFKTLWFSDDTFYDELEMAIKALLELDFTELVKGLPVHKIKGFVLATKIKKVEEAFS